MALVGARHRSLPRCAASQGRFAGWGLPTVVDTQLAGDDPSCVSGSGGPPQRISTRIRMAVTPSSVVATASRSLPKSDHVADANRSKNHQISAGALFVRAASADGWSAHRVRGRAAGCGLHSRVIIAVSLSMPPHSRPPRPYPTQADRLRLSAMRFSGCAGRRIVTRRGGRWCRHKKGPPSGRKGGRASAVGA